MEIAYLGPEGTYSEMVAQKRFGRGHDYVPCRSIRDVCAFAGRGAQRAGVIPIENSSGGAILETVDILLAGQPRVKIREEVSLNVRLALLGTKGKAVQKLYSHFAPLDHAGGWIRTHLPGVEKVPVPSTAVAAETAAAEPGAAALGSRKLAALHGLDILTFPVEADVPNTTVFLLIGNVPQKHYRRFRTTAAVTLRNQPGALCTFLETFRDHDVNLSRLLSRPLRGCPGEYAFLVDIDGDPAMADVRAALRAARRASDTLRLVGTFGIGSTYTS